MDRLNSPGAVHQTDLSSLKRNPNTAYDQVILASFLKKCNFQYLLQITMQRTMLMAFFCHHEGQPQPFSGLTHASRMRNTQERQLYLCSPKSCRPRVQRRELAWPLRWRRSERLPCLSTITPKALRTLLHSARCPQARPRPAGPCTPGRRRERGRRKEQCCVSATSGREFQTPALLEQSRSKDTLLLPGGRFSGLRFLR